MVHNHDTNTTTNQQTKVDIDTVINRIVYNCKQKGHRERHCPELKQSINKVQSHSIDTTSN